MLTLLLLAAPAVLAQTPGSETAAAPETESNPGEPQTLPTIPVPPPPEPPQPAAPLDQTPAQLDEVVVTAQKKVQNLQKVPISVGVIDGETLKQTGSFDTGSLERYVANIEVDSDPQAPVIGIRGFSTETDNVGFEPSVGLVLDDLALARPEFIADGLFDVDRIEVLRGSQGTLFGKNTIAGVLTFRTADPGNTFAGDLMGSFGDPEQKRVDGGVTLPVAEWLSARVSGVWWEKDGDVDNSTLDRVEGSFEQRAGRVKLLAWPGDHWKVGLSSQISDSSSQYGPWQLYDADADALRYAQSYDPSTEDDPLDSHTAFNMPGYADRESELSRAFVEYDAGSLWGLHDLTFVAIGGRAAFDLAALIDVDVSAADLITTDFRVDYTQDSLELRAAGRSDSLFGLLQDVDWVVGLYGLDSDIDSHLDTLAGDNLIDFALSNAGLEALGVPTLDLLGPILDGLPNLDLPIDDRVLRGFVQSTDSTAIFGQMNWNLTERLAAILGGRFGQDRKEANWNVQTVGPGIVALVVGAEAFQAQRSRKESDFSPRLGVQYEWSRDLMSYASYTRGFKGGGFNATAESNSNLEFEAEKARSWEAGIKSRFFGRALTLNAGLYRTDVSNLQVLSFVGTSFQPSNAGKARLEGIELDARWRPSWSWLTVTAATALTRAKYLSYPNAPEAPESADDDDDDTQDLTGRTLAHAPKLTATLSPMISLPLPLTQALGVRVGVDLSYRGDQYSSTDLDSHSFQEGYMLVGARLIVGPSSGRWALIVNGSNLTNKRAIDLVMNNPVYANTYIAPEQIPLRSWTASVRVNWF